MPTQQTTLLSPTELAYLHSSLSLNPPLRPDARSPTTFRPLIAETDLLPSTNGSARVCFADGTEGIVGVKADIQKTIPASTRYNGTLKAGDNNDVSMGGVGGPQSGLKDEEDIAGPHGEPDWVDVTIDMPGQRDDDSTVVFLAQMIHEGLVADGTLPLKLYINRRWHWKLYIDVGLAPSINSSSLISSFFLVYADDLPSTRSSSSRLLHPIPFPSSPSPPTSLSSPPVSLLPSHKATKILSSTMTGMPRSPSTHPTRLHPRAKTRKPPQRICRTARHRRRRPSRSS